MNKKILGLIATSIAISGLVVTSVVSKKKKKREPSKPKKKMNRKKDAAKWVLIKK